MSDTVAIDNIVHNNTPHHDTQTNNVEKRIIYDGYFLEQRKMTNISQRCGHNLAQFQCSAYYISFVMKVLNNQFTYLQNEIFVLNDKQAQEYAYIARLVANGICKCCANTLVRPLIIFADKVYRYQSRLEKMKYLYNVINSTLSCLIASLIQYPSISVYFFRNSLNIGCTTQLINVSFCKLCLAKSDLRTLRITNANLDSCSKLLGNQILRNAYLLKKSECWTTLTIYLMCWIIDECYYQMMHPGHGYAVWNATWILCLSFYYHKKEKKFNEINKQMQTKLGFMELNVIKWRKQLHSLLTTRNHIVKKICIKLLKASNEKLNKKPKIIGIVKKIWKIKAQNMECVYLKCNKKLYDGKMYICCGCRIARYCSKSCQKKHWIHGQHKKLCR
eukprot:511685_1